MWYIFLFQWSAIFRNTCFSTNLILFRIFVSLFHCMRLAFWLCNKEIHSLQEPIRLYLVNHCYFFEFIYRCVFSEFDVQSFVSADGNALESFNIPIFSFCAILIITNQMIINNPTPKNSLILYVYKIKINEIFVSLPVLTSVLVSYFLQTLLKGKSVDMPVTLNLTIDVTTIQPLTLQKAGSSTRYRRRTTCLVVLDVIICLMTPPTLPGHFGNSELICKFSLRTNSVFSVIPGTKNEIADKIDSILAVRIVQKRDVRVARETLQYCNFS